MPSAGSTSCSGERRSASIPPLIHIELDGGQSVAYDRLLLALGSRPRRLPAMESGPVHHAYLRSLRDALEIRDRLRPGSKIVFWAEVSSEWRSPPVRCCATATSRSSNWPRESWRVRYAPPSRNTSRLTIAPKGVKLALEAHATGQVSSPVPGLLLRDGAVIPADLIVIGVGVTPNTDLASAAGIRCEDGIVVDEFGATSAPDVYASGDAVRYPDEFFGRSMRSENWMHAQNQSLAVAKNLLGRE